MCAGYAIIVVKLKMNSDILIFRDSRFKKVNFYAILGSMC